MNKCHFIGCDVPYENANVVLFGAPFDSTVSFRPGTRFAPNRIRIDSEGLETYSPYQDADIEDLRIADIGDIDVFYGNAKNTLDVVYKETKKIISDGKIPLMIGGEHLLSYPSVKAAYEQYPDLRVIHFDAHTDYRNDYLGESLSHATVMKRIHDVLGEKRIYSFGIRSGEKQEFTFAKEHQYIERFDVKTVDNIVEEVSQYPIYLTLDLDVLDPAYMAGTGTQEPGGLTFKELLTALLKLKNLNIIGLDIMELSPDYDVSGASTSVATKLIRELLLLTK